MEKYNNRSEVPNELKWDLSNYFKDDSTMLKKLEELSKKIPLLNNYIGCTSNIDKMMEYLKFDLSIACEIINMELYSYCRYSEDLGDSTALDNFNKVESTFSEYVITNSFFEPELLSIKEEDFNKLINNEKIGEFKNYLKKLYRKKGHTLSEDKEKIVGQLTKNLKSYEDYNSNLINSNNDYGTVVIDGKEETVSLTNLRVLMRKCDREKRKRLYEQFNKVIKQYSSTSAIFLNDFIRTNDELAKIYNFENSWEQSMYNLELDTKIFDTLTQSLLDNKNVVKKFDDIKAKNLGVEELMPWDSALPFHNGNNKEYTVEEAHELLIKALSPLGEDYIEHYKEALNGRHIDYAQYKGKKHGGYNINSLDNKYSKILMSYNADLESVSTLAHEGGHHVNHQYIYENNCPLYTEISPITAEVTSLTNECLLSSYLASSSDKEEALRGIANIIEVFDTNFVGAIIDGNIERKMYEHVHEGGSLTKDYLANLSKEEILKVTDKDNLKSEYQAYRWAKVSHYFMNFYLYSYSISISVACYVAKNILEGNKDILNKYKEFLKCGSDKSIIDTYKVLGIDLTDKKVYEEAIEYFNSMLDKYVEIKDGETDGIK